MFVHFHFSLTSVNLSLFAKFWSKCVWVVKNNTQNSRWKKAAFKREKLMGRKSDVKRIHTCGCVAKKTPNQTQTNNFEKKSTATTTSKLCKQKHQHLFLFKVLFICLFGPWHFLFARYLWVWVSLFWFSFLLVSYFHRDRIFSTFVLCSYNSMIHVQLWMKANEM